MDEEIFEAVLAATEEAPEFHFATVGEVFEDGLTLIFDGQEEATEKRYKCNTSVVFHAGDRVKILKDSGTYVAEYVVGPPGQTGEAAHGIPSGGAAGQVLTKTGSADYESGWAAVPAQTVSALTSGTYEIGLTSAALVPKSAGSSAQPYALGTSALTYYQSYVQTQYANQVAAIGAYTGLKIGAANGYLGFHGVAPITKPTLSTASANQGYTGATDSNHLIVLNNVVGILKKYGLMA